MDEQRRTLALIAGSHARAAQRRTDAVLEAVRAVEHPAPFTLVGEAAQAVLALHLALVTVSLYEKVAAEPGPHIKERATIAARVRHLRDTVMHWEGKGRRYPDTFLYADDRGVVVEAPPGQVQTEPELAGVTWHQLRRTADAIYLWSLLVLEPLEEPRAT